MTNALLCTQINGLSSDLLPATDRGLTYGHGLFETIRFSDGAAPLLERHLARLHKGAKQLGIAVNASQIFEEFERFQGLLIDSGQGNAVIKLILTAGSGGRGYGAPQGVEPSRIFQAFSVAPAPRVLYLSGISVRVCQYRLPASPQLAGIKHLNRLDQIIARSEWHDDAVHEGLMLDQHDHVIEATSSNLFAGINGRLVTPELESCGVQGVMRQLLLDSVIPEVGLKAAVGALRIDDIGKASELFLCNALQGVRPVCELLGVKKYPIGPLTQKIQAELGRQFSCYQV